MRIKRKRKMPLMLTQIAWENWTMIMTVLRASICLAVQAHHLGAQQRLIVAALERVKVNAVGHVVNG